MQNLILVILMLIAIIIVVKAQIQFSKTRNVNTVNNGKFWNNNNDLTNSTRKIRNNYYNEHSTTLNYFKTSSDIKAEIAQNYYSESTEATLNYNYNNNDRVKIFKNSFQSGSDYNKKTYDENSLKAVPMNAQKENEFKVFNNENFSPLNQNFRLSQERYTTNTARNYHNNKNVYSNENSQENYHRYTQKTTQYHRTTTKKYNNAQFTPSYSRKPNVNVNKNDHSKETTKYPSNNYSTRQSQDINPNSYMKNITNNFNRAWSSTELIRNNNENRKNSQNHERDSMFITTPITFSENDFSGRSSKKHNNQISTTKPKIIVSGKRISQRKYEEYIRKVYEHEDAKTSDDISPRIVFDQFNGRDVAEPGQYPHMAAIGFKTTTNSINWECGGSLIDEYFIITAAHCTEINGQKPFYVKIGDINLNVKEKAVEPQSLIIKDIYKHPKYTKSSYYNDIALIKLSSPALFTEFVYPIRLWENNNVPYKKVFAMGYGATEFGKAKTNILTHLNLTLVSNTECNINMPKINETRYGILDTQICAIDPVANRDTCQGDSGGPLQLNMEGDKHIEYALIGITSYGLGCGGPHPSVYTRVSAFLDWIEEVVWPS